MMFCGSAASWSQPKSKASDWVMAVEAHVGTPSAAETQVMLRLREDLEVLGLIADPLAIKDIVSGQLAQPGVSDPEMTADKIAGLVDAGYDSFTKADLKATIEKETRAIEWIKQNPALLAYDTGNNDMIFRAYMSLAFSQREIYKSDIDSAKKGLGEETLSELIRMNLSPRILHIEFGPRAEEWYLNKQKELNAKGRAELIVKAKEGSMVFIDNQLRGRGSVDIKTLLVGIHHAYVQSAENGTRYEVDVLAHTVNVLDTTSGVDSVFSVTNTRAGFEFPTELARRKEGAYAGQLVSRWKLGDEVVVFGPMVVDGNSAIVASRYSLDGQPVQPPGYVLVDQADSTSLSALALFVAKGSIGPSLHILSYDVQGILKPKLSDERSATLPTKIIASAGAAVVVGAGIVYATSKADDFTKPTYDDKKTPAVEAMVGGSVILGAGTVLWLRQTTSANWPSAALLGAGLTGLVAGGTLYLTDQDPSPSRPGLYVRQYYRDTATSGVILGTAGVAMTGLGFWLWHRDVEAHRGVIRSYPPVVTTLAVTPSQALVTFTGTF